MRAGKVLSIMVAEGDAVEGGSLLPVPEAMKMASHNSFGRRHLQDAASGRGERVAHGASLINRNKEG
jgi:acetyl/propionyl-CoA carboxylase alpha subunit